MITSDDDFGINSAGMMIAETTISQFEGWDPNGKPEFMRSRKALQYANSIDDYVRIIKEGNNGGYANDWLIGDRKSGEIAYLELGLKNTPLWRTKDGYFVSSNFARDPKVLAEEAPAFDTKDLSLSSNARRVRWEQLMGQNKGKIDVGMAEQFLADHTDSYEKKEQPDERSLCGHVDASPRGVKEWEWSLEQSRRCGTRQGHRQQYGQQDEFCGPAPAILAGLTFWRRISSPSIRSMTGRSRFCAT